MAKRLLFALILLFCTCVEVNNVRDPESGGYVPPEMTIDWENSTISAGALIADSSCTLALKANLSDNLFRWKLNQGVWSSWLEAVESRFMVSAVLPDSGGCTLSVQSCYDPKDEKNYAAATVFFRKVMKPSILQVAKACTTTLGASCTLWVKASATPPLTYGWYHKGTKISGASKDLLILSSIAATDSGSYECTVGNPYDTVESASMMVVVILPTLKAIYDLNGGNGTVSDDSAYYPGNHITVAGHAGSKGGFEFAGWKIKDAADDSLYHTGDTLRLDTISLQLVAQWREKPVGKPAVRFVFGDGATADTTIYVESATLNTAPPAPERTGYEFEGWFNDTTDSKHKWDFDNDMVRFDTTLYAVWERDQYRITFVSGTGADATTVYLDFGSKLTEPSEPQRSGFELLGWSANNDSKVWVFANDTVVGDMTLTAQWEPQTYKINFDANDLKASGTMASQSAVYKTSVKLNKNKFHKPGWRFAGWARAEGGSKVYNDSASLSMEPADMKLYALWSPNTYSITFVPNDAAITDSSYTQSAPCDSVITLYKNRYQKSGFSFRGWTVHPDSQKYIGDEATITMDTTNSTFYAQWTAKPIHNITATADSGVTLSPSGTLSIIEGESQTYSFVAKPGFLLSVVQVDGSENASAKASGTYTFENVDTAHQLSVTSIKKRFSLSYSIEADVGTVTGSIDAVPAGPQIDAGTTVVLTAPPDDGYAFLGWVKMVGGAEQKLDTTRILHYQVTDTTVLKAVYAKSYTIDYVLGGNDVVLAGDNPARYTAKSLPIVLKDPTREAFYFMGWYADSAFTIPMNQIPSDTSGDLKLFARWGVQDYDKNVYTTVTFGDQVWTVENLRTTHFNNGAEIPHVTDSAAWVALTTSGYCYYNNSTVPDDHQKWGALYNWYTVNTGKLAPAGWRVPSDADWTKLEQYLIAEGYNYDGSREGNHIGAAMAAQTDWEIGNEFGMVGEYLAGNNSSGFSALPGGCIYYYGSFLEKSYYGNWWSATEDDALGAFGRYLGYDSSSLKGNRGNKKFGFSVRLVRDN